jgi:hypothetical protein
MPSSPSVGDAIAPGLRDAQSFGACPDGSRDWRWRAQCRPREGAAFAVIGFIPSGLAASRAVVSCGRVAELFLHRRNAAAETLLRRLPTSHRSAERLDGFRRRRTTSGGGPCRRRRRKGANALPATPIETGSIWSAHAAGTPRRTQSCWRGAPASRASTPGTHASSVGGIAVVTGRRIAADAPVEAVVEVGAAAGRAIDPDRLAAGDRDRQVPSGSDSAAGPAPACGRSAGTRDGCRSAADRRRPVMTGRRTRRPPSVNRRR